MNRPSRRDFLKVLTSYLVGLSGLLGPGRHRTLPFLRHWPRLARPSSTSARQNRFAVGSRTRVGEIPALILRDSGWFQRPEPAVHASGLHR